MAEDTPSRRDLLTATLALAATELTLPGLQDAHAAEPLRVVLPQHERRLDQRRSSLEEARDTYRYTYDKQNLRGVAMCEGLPSEESPSCRWVRDVGRSLRDIAANEQETNPEGLERPARIVKLMNRSGASAALFAQELVLSMVPYREAEGLAESEDDFKKHFSRVPLPLEADDTESDECFVRLRLAGPNPAWIRRVDPSEGLPEDFAVTEELAAAGLGEGDSLEAALAEGRLFTCTYRRLLSVETGGVPVPPDIDISYSDDPAAWDAAYARREAAYASCPRRKKKVAPLALFVRPREGRSLRPVAIQLLPTGFEGKTYPVLTPADGMAWLRAKTMVNTADASVHEAVSHLALTHLVQEAFGLAMRNCLATRHPLHRLLEPHFEGTIAINSAADYSLVRPAGGVDVLLNPTIGGSIKLGADALADFDFNASMFPAQLEARGVLDPEHLPDYPYRDDGLLVWAAQERWVRAYVSRYYSSDDDVVEDTELQAFVRQVGQYKTMESGRLVGGGLKGMGEAGGGVQTRDYLVKLITQIIFNGSAQHAAVNFPQAGAMLYAPLMPLSTFGPLPERGDSEDREALLRQLPTLSQARQQVLICYMLGSVQYTRLGQYGERHFDDVRVERALSRHKRELRRIERTMVERDQSRYPYPYLRPSLIPQSTNI